MIQIKQQTHPNKFLTPYANNQKGTRLDSVECEYQILSEEIDRFQDIINQTIKNNQGRLRDKFLVNDNRVSIKFKEVKAQEGYLETLERGLNDDSEIHQFQIDLESLKIFNNKKELQYKRIQDYISKDDFALQGIKQQHQSLIDHLKLKVEKTVEQNLQIEKLRKIIKFYKKDYQKSYHHNSTSQLNEYLQTENSQLSSQIPTFRINKESSIHAFQTSPKSILSQRLNPLEEEIKKSESMMKMNKTHRDNKFNFQDEIISLPQSKNKAIKSLHLKNSISEANKSQSEFRKSKNMPSFLHKRDNVKTMFLENFKYSKDIKANSIPLSLNSNTIRGYRNEEYLDTKISHSTKTSFKKSEYEFPSVQLNTKEGDSLHFSDTATKNAEYQEIVKQIFDTEQEISKIVEEVQAKKQQIFKQCNKIMEINQILRNSIECSFKKLQNNLSLSDKQGYQNSAYLTIRTKNPFITQQDDLLCNTYKESIKSNKALQEKQEGSIIFQQLVQLLNRQKQAQSNRQVIPQIPYRDFANFSINQILTLLNLSPQVKNNLLIPFEIKKQTVHIFLQNYHQSICS